MPRKRPVYYYNPIDTKPDIAVGIKLPFNTSSPGKSALTPGAYTTDVGGASVFELSYTTVDQAISNLKNLILTRKGERLYHPNFGTTIYDSLFEPMTEDLKDDLTDGLTEDIKFWLPYITIQGLDVQFNYEANSINMRLEFSVSEIDANQRIIILMSPTEGINIIE
jgi:phage baseplate assembly protein W